MSNYKEVMARKSDLQLVKIVEYDFNNYNKEALKSAGDELKSRKLTGQRIEEITLQIKNALENKAYKEERLNHLVKKGKHSITQTVDAIHPMTPKKDETIIKLIAAYIGLILVITIYENYYQLIPRYFSFFSLELILTVALSITAIYGLLNKKRSGWIILGLFLSYQISVNLVALIHGIIAMTKNGAYLSFGAENDLGLINNIDLFGRYNPAKEIALAMGGIFVCGGILWFLCKPRIQGIYLISEELRSKILIAGFSFGLLLHGILLWGLYM